MATPLTAFSKYTGVLMAVLCAMLMISFVVADPLMQYAGGGGGAGASRAGEIAASWRGGQINERQLDAAVRHRRVLAAFQQTVFQTGMRDAMTDGAGDLPLRVQPLELRQSYEQGVERDVVQTKVFAERATEAGMVVSDEMIVDYLRAIGRDRVSNDQMRGILSRMQVDGGRKATISFIFDLLREAMLAKNYLVSHSYTFETTLPAERWEDWLMVNETVSVEAAPLRVEDFVDQVEEPSDAELAEFFELYRNREPSPEILSQYGGVELPSPLPAFATPPRVRIAYLEANFDRTVDKLAEGVTDEDIAAFYEENKESFVEADRALFGDLDLFEDDAEEPVANEESANEEAAQSDAAPADDTPDAASEEDNAEAEGAEEMAEPEAEADAPEETVEEAAEETADEAAEDTSNPLREQPAEEAEAATEAVEEEEEEEEEGEAEEQADPAVSYQPLEEVADEIRRRIAMDRGAETLQGLMNALKSELDDDYVDYFDKVLDAEDAEADPPAPPESLANLQPLADANELELVELGPISQLKLRESTVGGSYDADPSAQRSLPLWFLAFRPKQLDAYQPIVTYDVDGNRYLVLVTDRIDGEKPELADIRDEVVAAWKREKAAELALAKGEELAAAATEAGQTLRDYLAGVTDAPVKADDAFETESFSFLTVGTIAPGAREVPLRLSQPEPLVAPGPELLEAVFDLGPDGVTAQPNHDRSLVYLIKVAQRQRTPDELRGAFIRDGDNWFGAPALMRSRIRRAASALVGELLETADLDWRRTPDQPGMEG